LYGDLGLRPSTDLDLVVRKEQALRAIDILRGSHYEPDFPITDKWSGRYVRQFIELPFSCSERHTRIDLHWGLLDHFLFNPTPEQLWSNPQVVSLDGLLVKTLSVENTLWYLCVHAAKHDWLILQWLVDIAELLRRRPDVDWDRLFCRRAVGASSS